MFIDRSESGVIPDKDERYAGRRWAPCRSPRPEQPLKLHILVDWSSVELLADEGQVSLTEMILPQGRHQIISLYAQGGSAECGECTVWPLRPANGSQDI